MDAVVESREAEVLIANGVVETPSDVTLPRAAAAGSLVLSGALLMADRRKSALAAVAVAGAIVAFEHPEMAKRFWSNLPQYLRRGHDFLTKVEDVVSEISAQSEKMRESFKRE